MPRRGRPAKQPALDTSPGVNKELKRWQVRVNRAKQVRRDWEQRYLVETCERFFLGNQHEYGALHPWFDVQENEPTFNYVWAAIQDKLPSLYYQNPTFHVTPMQPGSTAAAEQVAAQAEALLRTVANEEQHLKHAGQLAVIQNFFRLGALKVIYDPRLEPNPQAGESIYARTPEGQPILDPATGLGVPVLGSDGKPMTEPERILTDEVYRWRWVDAACLLLPDQGPDPSRWTWIGEEVFVPLEVAKDDMRFKKSTRDKLVANCTNGRLRPQELGTGYQEQPSMGETEEFLCYYECWDIWNKKYYCWAEGQPFGEDFLVEDDYPAGIDNHPYCLAIGFNTPILGPTPCPWPVPIVFQWLSVQREYNTRRKQITQGAGRSARKILYEDNTFPDEDEAIKALQSPEDLSAAKITTLERPPVYMTDPPLPADIIRDVALLQSDFRALAGVTASALQSVQAGQSPTEAGMAQQLASQRELVMRDVITDMFQQAGQKMHQLLQATMTLDKLVKIRQLSDAELQNVLVKLYGQQITPILQMMPNLKQQLSERFGTERWARVTRESINFESQVSIVPGSMRARTSEVERQQLLAFLSTLGQAPQLALSRELLRIVAQAFEIESESLLDELNALAHQMVEVNARQAGRYQGGDNAQSQGPTNTPAQNGGMPPQVANQLQMALMGRR